MKIANKMIKNEICFMKKEYTMAFNLNEKINIDISIRNNKKNTFNRFIEYISFC